MKNCPNISTIRFSGCAIFSRTCLYPWGKSEILIENTVGERFAGGSWKIEENTGACSKNAAVCINPVRWLCFLQSLCKNPVGLNLPRRLAYWKNCCIWTFYTKKAGARFQLLIIMSFFVQSWPFLKGLCWAILSNVQNSCKCNFLISADQGCNFLDFFIALKSSSVAGRFFSTRMLTKLCIKSGSAMEKTPLCIFCFAAL